MYKSWCRCLVTCALILFANSVFATDINESIQQSTDDAQSTNIGYDDNDTYYYIANNQQIAGTIQGWRFQTVDIPQGATITVAELWFAGVPSCANGGVGCKSICYGVDTDDIDTWEDNVNEPNTASQTTAYDTYESQSNFAPDGSYATFFFDVTIIVQEIIDRVGWISGNNMAFVTKDNGSTAGFLKQNLLKVHTYDATAPEPWLEITYSTVEGVGQVIIISS